MFFSPLAYLLVAAGGALGSIARFWLTAAAARWWGDAFPTGTVLINVIGSCVIGFFAALAGRQSGWLFSDEGRAFVMVGLCGGFTTFSSFSLQTMVLLRAGLYADAALNVAMSAALCLAAVFAGYAMGVRL